MDIIRLYNDFSVDYKTEGHKHTRQGWVNTECPFCVGNPGYHLGWNIQEEYFMCWRCGWHPPISTISTLLKVSTNQVPDLLVLYGVNRTIITQKKKDKKEFSLPSNITGLGEIHKRYLKQRHFSPEVIEKKWKITGTGPVSKLDKIFYKYRILIPFVWNGQVVSFDSRDVTNKQMQKYMACPEEREIINHKHILYGNQEMWEKRGICVEGPTDVWRLGERAFATSGIRYTQEQVRVIANSFKEVAVVFDGEFQAQVQASKLVSELKFRGVDAWIESLKGGDPGSLVQRDANSLVKYILNKKR
jgi:hypothetical protein